ncbi:hypothetical protein DFH27DRAFT_34364 [Peziza echinospora]|nr:hypothetical protein DFH27DRAFT_34364 [Peziza echinospora]
MKCFISYATLVALAAMPAVQAHIALVNPPPINHPLNKFAVQKDTDYLSPISQICKGYHKLTGAAMTPVATWPAGSSQKFELTGSAIHGGGSCQASISEDGGATFKTIKTFQGGCPVEGANSFDIVVPKETKNGPVLFAWTWFNKVGNREMYMNCASVEITGGGAGLTGANFPPILVANIGGDCKTVDNVDPLIPAPGPNVVTKPSSPPAAAPIGAGCGAAAPPTSGTVKTQVEPVAPVTPPPPVVSVVKTETTPQTGTVKTDSTGADKIVDTTKPGTVIPIVPPIVLPKVAVEVPLGGTGGTCTHGQIICLTATTWALCDKNTPVAMGAVAPGTKCVNGAMTKRSAIRFSADHLARAKA